MGVRQFLHIYFLSGCSTIDYVLISSDLCSGDFVQSFKVFPCIESNHLPVGIVLKMNTSNVSSVKLTRFSVISHSEMMLL